MMRRCWLSLIAVLFLAAPAAAQQGFVQIIAASQITTGDLATVGVPRAYQPDFGISWFQPTRDWGTVNFDAHAVRGENDPRLGRALFAIKDLKRGGLTWNLDAGDSAYTPFLADYGFRNLFAPQVTFRGGSVSARGAGTSLSITAGRVTVFRDLFAADADALGQSLFVARATQKISGRVELVAHASRVRTEDLKGYNYVIESGDDVGAGLRLNVTKKTQVIADAGLTSYRRKDATDWEQQPSAVVGVRWTGKQGWFQVDAHRFSPGNFSVVNNPYNDREGLFAGGEYGFSNRVRLFGGWDMFGNDRQADARVTAFSWNNGTSSRAYGGARLRLDSHFSIGGRVDEGARVSRPSPYSVGYQTDTGSVSTDWQLTFARVNAIGRYEHRSNVDTSGGVSGTRFAEDDMSAQLYFNVTRTTRLYSTLFRTERRNQTTGDWQSFLQLSAGTQFQVGHPGVFAHGEVVFGRDRQMQSDFLTPRTAFTAGLSGQLARHVSLAIDMFANRSPMVVTANNPWTSRTVVRLVYNAPTGAPATSSVSSGGTSHTPRGSETIDGTVFVDWNSNGVQDPGEEALAGVRVVLDNDLGAISDAAGRIRFEHITAGAHVIAIDVPTVPASFDPPATTTADVTARHASPRVAFGMLPLGDILGVIMRDSNGDGTIDERDEPMDGAVLVLDDGARTEVARRGLFTFTGVRLGTHAVQLLLESLPDGATVAGEREIQVQVTREQKTPVVGFLVKADRRPEIRRVFPANRTRSTAAAADGAKGGGNGTAARTGRPGSARTGSSRSGSRQGGR